MRIFIISLLCVGFASAGEIRVNKGNNGDGTYGIERRETLQPTGDDMDAEDLMGSMCRSQEDLRGMRARLKDTIKNGAEGSTDIEDKKIAIANEIYDFNANKKLLLKLFKKHFRQSDCPTVYNY